MCYTLIVVTIMIFHQSIFIAKIYHSLFKLAFVLLLLRNYALILIKLFPSCILNPARDVVLNKPLSFHREKDILESNDTDELFYSIILAVTAHRMGTLIDLCKISH